MKFDRPMQNDMRMMRKRLISEPKVELEFEFEFCSHCLFSETRSSNILAID